MRIKPEQFLPLFSFVAFPAIVLLQYCLGYYFDWDVYDGPELMMVALNICIWTALYLMLIKKQKYSGELEVSKTKDEGLLFMLNLYEDPEDLLHKQEIHFHVTVFPPPASHETHGL